MILLILCIAELRLAMDTIDKEQIAKAFEHFLATGNLNSKTNLGLRQVSFSKESND
jgi:hypothetical protein